MIDDDDNTLSSKPEGDISIASYAELHDITLAMTRPSKRQLDIISRSLEPAVYDARDFLDAVKNMILTRRGKVRIVVLDPGTLISRKDHRFVEMVTHLSSYMEIRKPGEHHAEFNEAMFIADRQMVVYQKHSDRYEGMANFNAPRLAASLTENFDTIWQHSVTIPDFRRLML